MVGESYGGEDPCISHTSCHKEIFHNCSGMISKKKSPPPDIVFQIIIKPRKWCALLLWLGRGEGGGVAIHDSRVGTLFIPGRA